MAAGLPYRAAFHEASECAMSADVSYYYKLTKSLAQAKIDEDCQMQEGLRLAESYRIERRLSENDPWTIVEPCMTCPEAE